MNDLFQFYIDGKVKTTIGATFPLENFLEAFDLIAARKAVRKIVLTT
jgi:NADPH:quinone reductase-like Zn-dependent oxidoreductase